MKYVVVMMWICCQACYAYAEELVTKIQLVSEEWEDATNADGTGLYWDIIQKIYEPAGSKVSFTLYPYMRAVKMLQAQRPEADALVGSYAGEIGADRMSALPHDLFQKGYLPNTYI